MGLTTAGERVFAVLNRLGPLAGWAIWGLAMNTTGASHRERDRSSHRVANRPPCRRMPIRPERRLRRPGDQCVGRPNVGGCSAGGGGEEGSDDVGGVTVE